MYIQRSIWSVQFLLLATYSMIDVALRSPGDERDRINNLTLSFSANDGQGNVTFSTASAPSTITCFNLANIFKNDGNASSTSSYVVSNAQNFNSQTNYTSLFYQQLNTSINGDSSGIGTGKDAARTVEVFPGEDCRETGGLSWYGFSCQNEDGERYVVPGGVQSFSIVSKAESVKQENCWVLSERGSASNNFKGCFAAVMAAALTGTLLVLG
ncbi:hypothetical protein D6D22_06519 [Aureobasidium pullulans]|uniref:Uncharacterized protein n=1 Tax=Aureobasidium pullulans TaxID=5580 RepID=A0A4S8XM37_AURPU|nr:hypothetical protein D6D22_06519 [Aureobasidium pullulans]